MPKGSGPNWWGLVPIVIGTWWLLDSYGIVGMRRGME